MTTAYDIVTDAALFAGVGDVYNSLDANNSAMALRFLNYMLDSVSNEEYSVFDYVEITVPLVNGTQSYLVGPTYLGTPALRPNLIECLYIQDSVGISHPVQIIGLDQWASTVYKAAPGRPEFAVLNYNSDNVTFTLWPLESFVGDVLHILNYDTLHQFTTLAGVLAAPPGYSEWMVTSLAKRLAVVNRITLTADQKDIIQKSYQNMRAQNRDIHILATDVPVSDRTAFNIFTGNNNP